MAGRLPTIPDFLLKPFADAGNKTKIPETQQGPGRASLNLGFPSETQLPLSEGGVAPNRLDFQGILNQLAQFAFYYQSGGIMPYSRQVNYVCPALVFHDAEYWFCEQPNGPNAPAGLVAPGANDNVWTRFNPKKGGGGVPVGAIITYWGTTSPEGYLSCNGGAFSATQYPELYRTLGKAFTPDLRGYFVRGYDTRNSIDPDGSSRNIGSLQEDASRSFGESSFGAWQMSATGAFSYEKSGGSMDHRNNKYRDKHRIVFDPANVWGANHISTEFRPKNVCLLYCIKHD